MMSDKGICVTRARFAVWWSVLAAALLSGVAMAKDKGADWTFGGRAGAVSNYVARGYTSTNGGPALQGEVELEHKSGYFAGSFVSNISGKNYPGGSYELEFWSGYEHEYGEDSAVTAEAIYYAYPGANFSKATCAGASCPSQKFNTFEPRLGARWGWLTTRVSYALTDYFGDSERTGFRGSTKGTTYWELNADYELPRSRDWHAIAHHGYTRYPTQFAFPNPLVSEKASYWDLRLGVTTRLDELLKDARLGLFYTVASNRSLQDAVSLAAGGTRDLGRPAVFLGIDWSF